MLGIISTAFSLLAINLASLSEALSDKLKTDTPFASILGLESACIDIKISALFTLAMLTLFLSVK